MCKKEQKANNGEDLTSPQSTGEKPPANGGSNSNGESPDKNCKYYSIRGHIGLYLLWIFLVFGFCAFAIPWLIGGITMGLTQWSACFPRTQDFFNVGDNSILPDFMGGMVGLFAGFFIEWWLISKLRLISQFASIKTPLSKELKKIIEDVETLIKHLEGNIEDICREFFEWEFIKNLVNDVDDYNILYNLPGVFPLVKPKTKLADEIAELYKNIKEYEKIHKDFSECFDEKGKFNVDLFTGYMGATVFDKPRRETANELFKSIRESANKIYIILEGKDGKKSRDNKAKNQ